MMLHQHNLLVTVQQGRRSLLIILGRRPRNNSSLILTYKDLGKNIRSDSRGDNRAAKVSPLATHAAPKALHEHQKENQNQPELLCSGNLQLNTNGSGNALEFTLVCERCSATIS